MNGEWVLVGESVDLLTYQAAIHGYETPARIWCAITQTSFLICITMKTYAGRYFICMYLYETSLLINTSENSCSCSYQRIESSSNVAMLKREPAIERKVSVLSKLGDSHQEVRSTPVDYAKFFVEAVAQDDD